MNHTSFLFTLPHLTFNRLRWNKSIWQATFLTGLRLSVSFLHSKSSLWCSHYLRLFFCPFSVSHPRASFISDSSLLFSAESLCFSTRSSRAPSALGRQRWWREESSPLMFSSFLFLHCWLHTCSHLESGETHAHQFTFSNLVFINCWQICYSTSLMLLTD